MDRQDRYELLDKIGAGSFATVFRARDRELGREVAVKQIHQQYLDDPGQLDRYWQEAHLLASLHHPNIVTIFDVLRGRGWLILELMQANLAERMAGRQMDLRSLRSTLAHCLRALSYLHARGIVHGDIKPSNMMIDARRRIKIGDFGLARRVSDADGSLLKGTTKYMAPEVVTDEFGDVGPVSDLYSLGFSAYELLCGPNFESLFPGLSAFGRNQQVAWMMWHAASDRRLPDIHRVLSGVPDDLALVIGRLCEKDQSKRYESADAALDDLQVETRIVKSDDSPDEKTQEQPTEDAQRKKRMLAIVAFSASVVLSLVIGFLPWGSGGPGEGDHARIKYGIVAEVHPDHNSIKIEGLEDGIPEKIEIGKRPRIFLLNANRNILLRELRPGDRVEIKGHGDGPVASMTVSRPVSSGGRVKSIDLESAHVMIAVDEGENRDDLPLRVPDRAEMLLNGKPIEFCDLWEGDRVDVSHLAEARGAGGRVVVTLAARRLTEASGFVSDVDPVNGNLTIRIVLGNSDHSLMRPFAADCKISAQGDRSTSLQQTELKRGDRVRFSYDTEFREIIVTRAQSEAAGIVRDVLTESRQVVVSMRDGQKLNFRIEPSCDVTLGGQRAELDDLRNYDKVTVLYDNVGNQLPAQTLDAVRGPQKDRWAIVIANESFMDRSITPLRYSLSNARLLSSTLTSRYAFSEERILLLLDATRRVMRDQIARQLKLARRQMQVLVYVSTHAYVADDDRVYLAGRDFDRQRMAETGLPLDWLAGRLEACAAVDKILMFDGCHPATSRDLEQQPSTTTMLRKLRTPLNSTAAIASCDEGERGLDWKQKHRGLFAHFLAEGFGGRADRDRNLRITATELFAYLKQSMSRVPIEVGASQTPTLFVPQSESR